jgi:hypothetical protein
MESPGARPASANVPNVRTGHEAGRRTAGGGARPAGAAQRVRRALQGEEAGFFRGEVQAGLGS